MNSRRRETHATISINEDSIINILKKHYENKGLNVFDYQLYSDNGDIYADVRVKPIDKANEDFDNLFE